MTACEQGLDGVLFGCWLSEVLGTESQKILSVSVIAKQMNFLLNEMMMTLLETMPCKNLLVSLSANGNRSSLLGMPLKDPSLR